MNKVIILMGLIFHGSLVYAGGSYDFDGINDNIKYSTTTKSYQMTIMFWVKRYADFSDNHEILVGEDYPAVANNWTVQNTPTGLGWTAGKICFQWYNNMISGRSGWHGIETHVSGNVLTQKDGWSHIAVTRPATGFSGGSKMYINGISTGVNNIGSAIAPPLEHPTNYFHVGGVGAAANFKAGFANLLIFKRELSEAQINTYKNTTAPDEATGEGLLINIPFNESGGNPLNRTEWYDNTGITYSGMTVSDDSPPVGD